MCGLGTWRLVSDHSCWIWIAGLRLSLASVLIVSFSPPNPAVGPDNLSVASEHEARLVRETSVRFHSHFLLHLLSTSSPALYVACVFLTRLSDPTHLSPLRAHAEAEAPEFNAGDMCWARFYSNCHTSTLSSSVFLSLSRSLFLLCSLSLPCELSPHRRSGRKRAAGRQRGQITWWHLQSWKTFFLLCLSVSYSLYSFPIQTCLKTIIN